MNPNCPHCGRDLTDEDRHPVVHYGFKAWCDPKCMDKDLRLSPHGDLPEPDYDKLVLDTFREYGSDMTIEAMEELHSAVELYIQRVKSATEK